MDRELDRMREMVKKAQKSLNLGSYRIKSQIEDSKGSEYAEISHEHSKKTATIVFNRRKINNGLQNTIIHELLHLFLSKHLGVAESVFRRQKKYRSLRKYEKGEEEAVSVLARLLEKSIFGR